MKAKKITLLLLVTCLLGCAAGSVKPLLDQPDFKAENQPIRTLRILLITDDSYRKDEIEKWISRCSNLVEAQVGMRLEIVDWYRIAWEKELSDIFRTHIRIAADTWSKRDTFDVAVAPVYFFHRVGGSQIASGGRRYVLLEVYLCKGTGSQYSYPRALSCFLVKHRSFRRLDHEGGTVPLRH